MDKTSSSVLVPVYNIKMVPLFIEEKADAVFGSRFAAAEFRRVLMFRHELGNKLITFMCNWASNLNLTDVETCYKAVRTDLLKSIPNGRVFRKRRSAGFK